ncbi:hypothetical protein NX059_009311 [Plenodomus lindquistii]|nr:hypothetical protein NX059_009311 [Plenodomus lindquistii]
MTTEAIDMATDQPVPNGGAAASNGTAPSGNGEVDASAEKKRARSSTPVGDGSSAKRVKGVAPIKAEFVASSQT